MTSDLEDNDIVQDKRMLSLLSERHRLGIRCNRFDVDDRDVSSTACQTIFPNLVRRDYFGF